MRSTVLRASTKFHISRISMIVGTLPNRHTKSLTIKREDWEFEMKQQECFIDWQRHTEENEANMKKMSRQEVQQSGTEMDLQGGHVIESMVQLLRDGFILQLLSIEFIWRSAGKAGKRRMRSSNGQKPNEKDKDKKLMDGWRPNMLWSSQRSCATRKIMCKPIKKISIRPGEDMLPSYFY